MSFSSNSDSKLSIFIISRPCITRHLMNSKDCFFCKEVVVKIKENNPPSDDEETAGDQ